jgi:hypothetical protein
MSSMMNDGLKVLACVTGALAITAVMSWSLVMSTSSAPSAARSSSPYAYVAKITIQKRHVWFGQSQPAVLVD